MSTANNAALSHLQVVRNALDSDSREASIITITESVTCNLSLPRVDCCLLSLFAKIYLYSGAILLQQGLGSIDINTGTYRY
jgi:hypothetical protein